ncbi:hypothetical protein J2S14_004293 [Lederbergia wuyishanensis]|uniref:Transcription regulator HTH AraC N-terminal domain-containing protein n=1 Tax=Lederbergia wuyishanensis TaxID=1347903 RepID=A0ABU0DAI5_9BACI|nr:hypothetical protein [Lederbergia wuyishanensis]
MEEQFKYGPSDYLITSMNLPVIGQVTKASADVPYLSLRLDFSHMEILEVLNNSKIQIASKDSAQRALFVGKIELNVLDSLLRLVRLLYSPDDIPYLAPIYKRELLYRLLQGQYGIALAQIALEGSSTYRIRDVIEHIN